MKKSLPFIALSLFFCVGCFQASDDDELRTVPVTNNPYVIPNHGSSVPGGGTPGSSPY